MSLQKPLKFTSRSTPEHIEKNISIQNFLLALIFANVLKMTKFIKLNI